VKLNECGPGIVAIFCLALAQDRAKGGHLYLVMNNEYEPMDTMPQDCRRQPLLLDKLHGLTVQHDSTLAMKDWPAWTTEWRLMTWQKGPLVRAGDVPDFIAE